MQELKLLHEVETVAFLRLITASKLSFKNVELKGRISSCPLNLVLDTVPRSNVDCSWEPQTNLGSWNEICCLFTVWSAEL